MEFLIAGKKVEEHAGVGQVPLLALAEREDFSEQLLGLAAAEEVLLIRRPLIGITGRNRNADAELFSQVEKRRDVFCRMTVENRAVDVDGKTLGFRSLDRGHRLFEAAIHAYRLVVMLFDAVEMHGEEQIGRRLKQMQLLFQKQRVGAQRDEFLARDDAFDDFANLLVDQRFAARNGDHRRAALVDRVEALLHRQALVQDGVRIIDLAAADAGKIAAEQRFQHEHERVTFAPGKPLAQDV